MGGPNSWPFEIEESLSEEQIRAEWENELLLRLKDSENASEGELSGDQMRRLARDELRQLYSEVI